MPPSSLFARKKPTLLAIATVAGLGVLVLAGCGSDAKKTLVSSGGGTGGVSATTFIGTFASGTRNGMLTVTIAATSLAPRWNGIARANVNATGTAEIGGSSIALTGTYNTATDALAISGGGYSFNGSYSPTAHGRPTVNGLWTGPGGVDDSGEFVCTEGSAAVGAYCGFYHSTTSPPDSGSFTFSVTDSILVGYVHADGNSVGDYFEGKVRGTGTVKNIVINYDAGVFTLVAPGTLNTGTGAVAGTYTFTDVLGGTGSDDGTYEGKLCPQAPVP